jgi:putative flavoprotein involved in K+ transport
VQVGHELSDVASVTLATRHPVQFLAREVNGQDVRAGVTTSGFDDLPPAWLAHLVGSTLALDLNGYRAGLESGRWDQRPMFTAFHRDGAVWPDGVEEHVDTVIFATGYRPNLSYLQPLGALDADGLPLHTGGLSDTTPGLVYVGLEFQRSFASNTLRGVAHDVDHVVPALAAHVRNAAAAVGL